MNTPQKYDQNPVMVNSGTKYSNSHKRAMLIIIMNNPRLKAIRGAEIILSTGFMKKLIKPKINPAIIRVRISPSNMIPGTK